MSIAIFFVNNFIHALCKNVIFVKNKISRIKQNYTIPQLQLNHFLIHLINIVQLDLEKYLV